MSGATCCHMAIIAWWTEWNSFRAACCNSRRKMERLGIIEDTEHSDDSLRASKNEAEFVSPRPNVGEGSGVRGPTYSWMFSRVFRNKRTIQ
jgi:hypothetical protein